MYENENEIAAARFRLAIEKGAWDDWLFKDTELRGKFLVLNEKFQGAISAVRNKHQIDTTKYYEAIDWNTWPQAFMVSRPFVFDTSVTKILSQANLMAGWRRTINTYILTNIMVAPPVVLIHDTPDQDGIPKLTLEINDVIAKKDLDKLFRHINHWTEHYKYKGRKKKKPYPRMQYYFEMYELHKAGLTNSKISETLGKKYMYIDDTPTFTTRYVRESIQWLQAMVDNQLH